MAAIERLTSLLLLLSPFAARAEEIARLAAQSYLDGDGVSVISTSASASSEGARLRASGGWRVDIVSAASVDLVSQASPDGFAETRHEVELAAETRLGEAAWVGLTLGASRERDYQGNAAGLRGSMEIAGGSATLALRAVHAEDSVGRAGSPAFSRARRVDRLEASLTQLLDRASAVDLGSSLLLSSGYLASPYRLVPLATPAGSTPVEEAVPDRRARGQLEVRYRRRVASGTFSALELSGHADDWGVRGGALAVRVSQRLAGRWLTGTVRARAYAQSGASFWRRSYPGGETAPRLRTADKELSPLWSALGGLRLEVELTPPGLGRVLLDAGADVLDLHYTDLARLSRRTALLTSLGVEAAFP